MMGVGDEQMSNGQRFTKDLDLETCTAADKLRADYMMAHQPFDTKHWWYVKLEDAPRWERLSRPFPINQPGGTQLSLSQSGRPYRIRMRCPALPGQWLDEQ